MKSVLITGGTGFLGRRTAAYFRSLGFRVLTPSHGELDITDENGLRVWFRENRPDAVIHTAAISDTGLCRQKPEWSEKINVTGCIHLAKCCREYGTKLVICSSDQVYAGSRLSGPHREDEKVTPNNVYGNQKLRAEQACLEILPETVCLRLSWMYSTESFSGEKGHFLSRLKAALEDNAQILTWPVHDCRGITDTAYVVQNLPAALNLPGGIYNFGSENHRNTHETVKDLLETLCMDAALNRLVPDEESFRECPRNISMDTAKIRQAGILFPTTAEGLLLALNKEE